MIREYETIATENWHVVEAKGEATIAFLPYAARREEDGTGELLVILLRATKPTLIFSRIPRWALKLPVMCEHRNSAPPFAEVCRRERI